MAVAFFDYDLFREGAWADTAPVGGGGPLSRVDTSRGAVECAFARIVWRVARPAWTQAGWWDAGVRPEVRALMLQPVGHRLHQSLAALATADRAAGYTRGECPWPHPEARLDERLGVAGSPCACQIVVIAAWTAVASWVAAQADAVVVAAAGAAPVEELLVPRRPDLGSIVDPAVEEIAPAMRVSPGSARHRLDGVRRLAALPQLWAAVTSGLVVGWHAHLLVTDLRHLPQADRVRVIATLLERLRRRRAAGAREWTFTDLRAQAKRIAARLDLDLSERRKACHHDRGLRLRLHGQGAATLSADLADDVATRIFNRLTALAHGLGDDSDGPDGVRSLDQRRADVFTDLLLGSPQPAGCAGCGPGSGSGVGSGSGSGHDPASGCGSGSGGGHDPGCGSGFGSGAGAGHDPGSCSGSSVDGAVANPAALATLAGSEVAVVIDVATLLRLADSPAEVVGCGPVPAEIARQLAADARWRAWITRTDEAGAQVVATSATTYRPTAALARLIRAQEPHCRMPGCRATVTDLDHVVPYPKGLTSRANLGPLCRRHHRLKTHRRWRQTPRAGTGRSVDDDTDGHLDTAGGDAMAWTWTSPSGITYTDRPTPMLPDPGRPRV